MPIAMSSTIKDIHDGAPARLKWEGSEDTDVAPSQGGPSVKSGNEDMHAGNTRLAVCVFFLRVFFFFFFFFYLCFFYLSLLPSTPPFHPQTVTASPLVLPFPQLP